MILGTTWNSGAISGPKERPLTRQELSRQFERQVQPELPVLYRVARRMGCTPEEAEDIVQSCLLKAFRAWHRFDGTHLRSWLIRILRNERLMAKRSAKDTLSLDDTEAPVEIPASEPFWDEVAWRDQAHRILQELEKLPEIPRLIIQLVDVEDLSYEETATLLNIPVGTVRSRLFRARTLLRQKLTAEGLAPQTQEATP